MEGLEEARLLSLMGRYSITRVQGGMYGGDFYAVEIPGGGLVFAARTEK